MKKTLIALIMIGFFGTLAFAAETPKVTTKEPVKPMEAKKAKVEAKTENMEVKTETKEEVVKKGTKKAKRGKKVNKKKTEKTEKTEKDDKKQN